MFNLEFKICIWELESHLMTDVIVDGYEISIISEANLVKFDSLQAYIISLYWINDELYSTFGINANVKILQNLWRL